MIIQTQVRKNDKSLPVSRIIPISGQPSTNLNQNRLKLKCVDEGIKEGVIIIQTQMLLPLCRVIQFLENQRIQIRIAVDYCADRFSKKKKKNNYCADQETKIGTDLFIIQTQIAGSG